MSVNSDKPMRWKTDIQNSVDFYNDWFISFAPKAFNEVRSSYSKTVIEMFQATGNLNQLGMEMLRRAPRSLMILRMSTAPPLARERLSGLSKVPKTFVEAMEEGKIPPRMIGETSSTYLERTLKTIDKLLDHDLMPWLKEERVPTEIEVFRASTTIADRLCGSLTDPIIRNEQEKRQLSALRMWLETRGYRYLENGCKTKVETMEPGTFAFRLNVMVDHSEGSTKVKIPVDCVIKKKGDGQGSLPLLIEAKSAGDFTNVNKRRKEEAQKMQQMRRTYGNNIEYVLFLCGYFDSGYLGYEAAEGIDWVWEHRIDDLKEFGL